MSSSRSLAATRPTGRARGHGAGSPTEIPPRGWKEILLRTKDEIGGDRVGLIAAGCAFYVLLALFPALAAIVAVYGLVADPSDVARQVDALGSVLPAGGVSIIQEQLTRLTEKGAGSLSFAALAGVAFSLWSANNGIKTMFEAMNVAYDETEKRGFFKLTLVTLAFTAGALVLVILMIFALGIVPAILDAVGLGSVTEILITVLRWPLMALIAAVAISLLYRYGPSRAPPAWRWITPGSTLAAFAWIIASAIVGFYLANFANYDATYGSLGAAIGFMTWLWLSVFIVIAGAELDAEIEHQAGKTDPRMEPVKDGTAADALRKAEPSARRREAGVMSTGSAAEAGTLGRDFAERVGRAVGSVASRHKLASLAVVGAAFALSRRPSPGKRS